jgi:uncharacterized protein YndB with AHSA1/START domain
VTAPGPQEVVQEILIAAPPETVFEFFVDPELMRKWMGGHARLEANAGGVFAVDIGQNLARGSFLEVVPSERVVFTWGWEGSSEVPPGSSVVTFTFHPQEEGTLLRMVHAGLPDGEDVRHSHGWTHYLSRLTRAAIGEDPGPDPHDAVGDIPMHEAQA